MTALPPRPSPPWSVPPCFGAGPPAATSQTPLHRLRRERVSILPDLHRTLRRQHKSHQASSSLRFPLLLGDPFTLTPYSVSYFTSTSRGNNGPVFLTGLPRCLPPTSDQHLATTSKACLSDQTQAIDLLSPLTPQYHSPEASIFHLQSLAASGAPGAGSIPCLSSLSAASPLGLD